MTTNAKRRAFGSRAAVAPRDLLPRKLGMNPSRIYQSANQPVRACLVAVLEAVSSTLLAYPFRMAGNLIAQVLEPGAN